MRYYQNPVKRGFSPDPSVIRVDDCYYMVNSSFQYFPAIPISKSYDLVHWQTVGHVITNPDYLDLSSIKDSRGIWAPDISYSNGKYYVFASMRYNYDNADEHPMRRQLVAVADNPEGPYSKPWYLEVDEIDPSHFVDDDGRHYMVTAPGATIVPISADCRSVLGEPVQIWAGTGERCAEGPHIFKHNGYYYIMLASGGTGYGHGINIARSKELYGPYEGCPHNPVMRQTDPNALIQRSGHGMPVVTQNGQWWCLYLCGRRNGGNYTTVGRETALDRIIWDNDGWFKVGSTVPSLEAEAPDLPEHIFSNKNEWDFKDGVLTDFEWVRNTGRYTLNSDGLTLYPAKAPLYEISTNNILLHREEELSYTAELEFCYSPEQLGQQAGLTCYYSTVSYVRFSRTVDGLELYINRNNSDEKEELIASVRAKLPEHMAFKVEVNGLTRSFYYMKEDKWELVGRLEKCIYLCDEGVPNDRKRHTGTMVGFYCNNGGISTVDTPLKIIRFSYKNNVI